MPVYSIIIPVLDEAARIDATIAHLRAMRADAEIVIADGGSRDDTRARARAAGARVLVAPRGRGSQMNAGAAAARGEFLMFVHADCRLPEDAFVHVERALAAGAGAVTFRIRYESRHWLLRAVGALSRFESRLSSFGEGGLCLRRQEFEALGGFADWPLFEDLDLLARLRRRRRLVKLRSTVTASARRYHAGGVLRQQLRNLWLFGLFHAGVPVSKLVRHYDSRFTR